MRFARKTYPILEEVRNEKVFKNIVNYIRCSNSFYCIKSNNYCSFIKNGGFIYGK